MKHVLVNLLALATAAGALAAPTPSDPAPSDLRQLAQEQFSFAAQQYSGLLKQMAGDPAREPRTVAGGKLHAVGPRDWTSGFFPGSLWLIFEQTKDPAFRAAAVDFTQRLNSIQHFTSHHDVGFMLGCSYGEGWRITRDPAYRAVLIQGARSLATRYRASAGLIQSWDNQRWKCPVIIDNMMNLGLLWNAGVETGEKQFRDIVLSHSAKTRLNHFRPDGTTFHLVDYDPATGAVLKKQTWQGYADDTAWARGQSWAITGYATIARVTKDQAWLEPARKLADFLMQHPNMPADGVPYWDYNAPDVPNAKRDASAAAIMAVGLLDIAQQLGPDAGAPYREFAHRQIRSLASPAYRAALNTNGNFLLMHSVGHLSSRSEVDAPLNYADYYFLKALYHVLGGEFSAHGVP